MADANPIAHLAYRRKPLPADSALLVEIRRLFAYQESGGFVHIALANRQPKSMLGRLVGHESGRGYLMTHVLGHSIAVHRLVWLWHHGSLPDGMIDHANGDRKDNRIENLRIVTAAQSVWNRVRSNPLGAGVSPNGHGRFVARLQQPGGGEKIYLGTFDTAQEAAAAYIGASVITHGEYAAHKRRMKPRASEKLPTTPPATTAR